MRTTQSDQSPERVSGDQGTSYADPALVERVARAIHWARAGADSKDLWDDCRPHRLFQAEAAIAAMRVELAAILEERDLWHARAFAMFWKLPDSVTIGQLQDDAKRARDLLGTAPKDDWSPTDFNRHFRQAAAAERSK